MSLETYVNEVENGQDLIDLGVVPKTSSAHLALIISKRLTALRDRALTRIRPDILGSWMPAILREADKVSVLEDPEEIAKYVCEGMRFEAIADHDGKVLSGKKGRIVELYGNRTGLGVEFDEDIGGHSLKPKGDLSAPPKCKEGHGWRVPLAAIKLFANPGESFPVAGARYQLNTGVVADKSLGHRIRFAREYQGRAWNSNDDERMIAVPRNFSGTLIDYVSTKGRTGVKFDAAVPNTGNTSIWRFKLEDIVDTLEASSLGQLEPQDQEQVLMQHTLGELFPTTVIDTNRAYRVVMGLLMGKDLIFYGPPGAGKSQICKDIVEIAKQQGAIFIVEGCQANCNPFSLFNPEFAKVVPPCPECMIKFCPNFKETGIFTPPRPKDVKVTVARFTEGRAVEYLEGTVSLTRQHLSGYKMPRLDAEGNPSAETENDFDPTGYRAGALVRTNNGILHLDEGDKLRPQTWDSMLEAMNAGRIKPDQLRHGYPSNAMIVGTANDHTVFSNPVADRILLLAIRYPDDVDVRHNITRRAYHGEVESVDQVQMSDMHKERANVLRNTPMPVIIERAVDGFYLRFGSEYTGKGKTEISESNRCKIDALDASRAKLFVDRLFFRRAPQIVTAEYTMSGIQYALCCRVREANRQNDQEAKKELNAWVETIFPEALKKEEDVWWCNFYKHLAIAKTQAKGIEEAHLQEMELYKKRSENVVDVFERISRSYQPGATGPMQRARIDYPLMDFLYGHPAYKQPRFPSIQPGQLTELMQYFLASSKNTTCKIGGTK